MNRMSEKNIGKNYRFLLIMLASMILGSVTGWLWKGASVLKPLGTVFINLMFCIVVPLVFCSVAGSIAGMKNRRTAGKILSVTVLTFVITGLIAAFLMFVLMEVFPPVLTPWASVEKEEMGEYADLADMLVNFFTASDFVGLLSRKAMLPLIIFAILFGFAVNLNGGAETPTAKGLNDLTNVLMKLVNMVTCYAPVAFFAIFADMVCTYGTKITESYGRALLLYYPICFGYLFTMFPLLARFGGGRGAVRVLFSHMVKPVTVALGTCSSVATIPTNLAACEESGIPKDVSDMVIPLGATMHMDGSCLSCVLKIAFVFGALGTPLSWDRIVPVLLVAVLSSVGMSGVPGGGYIGEYIICSIFFPQHMEIAFPILVAIGNLVDPAATMINSFGNYVVAFVVARFISGKDWLRSFTEDRVR